MHLTVSFCNPVRIVDCEDLFFFYKSNSSVPWLFRFLQNILHMDCMHAKLKDLN